MTDAVFRFSRHDAALLALALGHGVLLGLLAWWAPSRPLYVLAASLAIAVGVWWNSNTVSHIHLHNPLFRARAANRVFSLYLSVLLGVPQTLWRDKHLWHHAGEPMPRRRRALDGFAWLEVAGVGLLFALLGLMLSRFALLIYAPGYVVGLLLCYVQGHYEHVALPVDKNLGHSYYGGLYNRLWFNDGYHAEHHRHPGEHWTRLPLRRAEAELGTAVSAFPPVLRFLDGFPRWATLPRLLDRLERLALRPGIIQRYMLRSHRRALCALLPRIGAPRRIAIVGGGLFPRSALLLGQLLPSSELTLIDISAANLQVARDYLSHGADGLLPRMHFLHARFDAQNIGDYDLVVVPLAFVGDRAALYLASRRPRPALLIHDWMWQRRGQLGVPISSLIQKRLNFVPASTGSAS